MITVNDVTFAYKGASAPTLKSVSLSIEPGECVLLCGRSGCGKTTLLRLLNGLAPAFYEGTLTGTVKVAGRTVNETPMYELAEKIGMVYQNPRSQFFNVDTDSELAFGLENLSFPRLEMSKRIEDTVRTLELSPLMGRDIYALSGGEKQKVAFGSIYAMCPEVYLLDEPSANLDADATIRLKAQLKLLKAQGKTIVITEHRLHYLRDIVDRAVYLENGAIVDVSTAASFFNQPEDQRVAKGLRALKPSEPHESIQAPTSGKRQLKIEGLSAGYNKNAVFGNLSYEAYAGEIVVVTGRNGNGKSTFAHVLCGLKAPLTGAFYLDHKRMTQKALLKEAYLVMQDVDYQLFADSVHAECKHGIANASDAVVAQVLKSLDLDALADCHPATLSGGQKQRLALAVSMVCEKSILVFDEPTSGLDFESMQRVAQLLRRLADMGKFVFVITHDQELITTLKGRFFCAIKH
ncbi:ABC transporter ATP-binding protein [Fusibacter sp. JL298sf-3]